MNFGALSMFLWGFVPGLGWNRCRMNQEQKKEEVTIPSGKHPKTLENPSIF
jgi:hypothetical protein